MRRSRSVAIVLVALARVAVAAQGAQAAPPAQAPAAGTPAPAGASAGKPNTPAQPEGYTYDPDGRRDPFVNLLGTGADPRPQAARRADGPAGIGAAEVSVSGILQSRGSLVAMITGPDKKTYIVHAGEKLLDGTIKAITAQGIVIVQDVNDPLSLVKQREVRKLLRSLEDAKE